MPDCLAFLHILTSSRKLPSTCLVLKIFYELKGPKSSFSITGDSAKQKFLEACSLRLRMAAEQKALELAKQESANREESVTMPGHVVWARSKGHPAWPSLVSTAEEASSHGLKGSLLFLFFTYLGCIVLIFLIQNPKDTA